MTLTMCLLACVAIAQQEIVPRVTFSAGSATDINGATSSAASVSPSLWAHPTANLTLGFIGTGTSFRGGAWLLAAGTTLSSRHPVGPAALVLNSQAAYTRTSHDLSYVTADLTPTAEVGVGPLALFGGGRVSGAVLWQKARTSGVPLPGGLRGTAPADAAESRRRSGRSALYGVRLSAQVAPTVLALATYREEKGRVAGEDQLDRSISAVISASALSFSGSVLQRNAADERSHNLSAAISLALSASLTFDVMAASYPSQRLTGVSAGRSFSAGVSLRSAANISPFPKAVGAQPLRHGMTRLSIAARNAYSVAVAGDFTDWKPLAARRAANNVWYIDLEIPPGMYRYAFRIDGNEWRTPGGAPPAEDEFGGKTAWLTVPHGTATEPRETIQGG